MYSYEIKAYIEERKHVLNREEFLEITDINRNPQIQSMKYNTYDDTYEMVTNDGYFFKFMVIRENE